MKTKNIEMTIDQYVEQNGIKFAQLARALNISPQNLQVKKKGGWPMTVDGDQVVFTNPKRPSDKRHHSIGGAPWLEK